MPFGETEDGIRCQNGSGYMCGLFHDEKGKPVHRCEKSICEAWSLIDELDGNASDLGDECNAKDDAIEEFKERLKKIEHPELYSS